MKEFSNSFFFSRKLEPFTVGPCVFYQDKHVAPLHDFISAAVGAVCNFMASVSSCTEGAGLPVCLDFFSLCNPSLSLVPLTFTFSYVMMLTELSFLSNTQANRILHGPKLVRARERKGRKKENTR